MNVLILGTSNSILKKGWVAGLSDAFPDARIDNRSVGASPGVQFALGAKLDYSIYDVVFFDSVPNDQEFLSLNVLDAANKFRLWEEVLHDLFSIIASQTCLIIIGFCHRNFLAYSCRVYTSRKRLAELLGIQFIDIRAFLNRFIEVGNSSPADLYESHPAHIRERLAFMIGREIGATLSLQPELLVKSAVAEPLPDRFFSLWADDTGLPTQTHKNSLMELRSAVLEDGHELHFPRGFQCLGFSLDIARTNCCLRLISTDNMKATDYLCYYKFEEGSVFNVFVPVLSTGSIRAIHVAKTPEWDAFQTMFSARSMEPVEPIRLALSAVSFWRDTGNGSRGLGAEHKADSLILSRQVITRLQSNMTVL